MSVAQKDLDLIDALNQLAAATPNDLERVFNTPETRERVTKVAWKLRETFSPKQEPDAFWHKENPAKS